MHAFYKANKPFHFLFIDYAVKDSKVSRLCDSRVPFARIPRFLL